jgi:PAS domain S-box-containing protein
MIKDKKMILLVEDEIVTSVTTKIMLEKYGYDVITASDGEDAIKKAVSNNIDCILMDIDLGDGIDGAFTAKCILDILHIPIIFVSSHTEPEVVEKTEKITSYGYVVKHSGITVLDASIKMAFRLHNARIDIQNKNNDLTVANEQLRVAIEELEAANEELIQSENIIVEREEALVESEHRYRGLFETMQEGFYLAELVYDNKGRPVDWRFIDVNPAHSKILGLKREEVIGNTVYELFPSLEKSWFDVTTQVALTGIPSSMEGYVEATGRYYENQYYSPKRGQFACIFTDITERKLADEALKKSEERYRSLMENLPVGVYRISLTEPEKLIDANFALARINKANSIEDILNTPVSSFFEKPDDMYFFISYIIEHGRMKDRIARLKRSDGSLIWGSITAECQLNTSGEPEWIHGIVEDVTEKIEIEEKISRYLLFIETLIDTISSPIFYKNKEGIYQGCNRTFAELIIGLPRTDIINKTIFELEETIPHELALKYAAKDKELFDNPGSQNYEAPVKCADGKMRIFHLNKTTYNNLDGEVTGLVGVMVDITDRIENEKGLVRINEEFNLLITSMASIIIGVSIKDQITHWNPYAEQIFDIKSVDVLNNKFCEIKIDWDWVSIYEAISRCILNDKTIRLDDIRFVKPDGKTGILGLSINPLKRGGNILEGFIILGKDLTDQRVMEQQLLQGSKLEALGQLAAGVAHEINTPLQYVGDNLKFINQSFMGLLNILDIYQRAAVSGTDLDRYLQSIKQAEELADKVKLPFVLDELPKAVSQSLEGIGKVSSIVQSMKAFSHPGKGKKTPANINKAIENTVTVSRNEWKYNSDLELKLDNSLPEVPCFESEFNQVLLNLIINAADAINDAKEKKIIEKGSIIISSEKRGDNAVITVTDNAGGIPENIKDKIFDPFFTTKEVGKGTGQGLPISFSIIHEKHGGSLTFETKIGKGTSFMISLPLKEE